MAVFHFRQKKILSWLHKADRVASVTRYFIFPVLIISLILRRESPAFASVYWIVICIVVALALLCTLARFLYSSFRTCPTCGQKLDFQSLISCEGDDLFCPECKKSFKGTLINWDLE